ncbi:MAG: response regulator [Methylacidiphilales bacterium]|nr:response regulator [Candidatus Methylacidiphilales bacterium]
MNKTFPILIVEDDLRLSETIRAYLDHSLPQVSPMIARSVAEAHVFIYQYEFSAFLIDLTLPDGDGLEFIVDLQTVLPDAKVVLMTGRAYEDVEEQLQQLGSVRFLQKPFDILALDRELRAMLPETEEAKPTFQGSLRQLRLVDLIQVKCLGHDSCKLHITGENGMHGVIAISGGAILHAETDRHTGIAAFNEILSWKGGVFYEEDFRGGVEVNIEGRWEMVLMEAVRLSDECHAMRAA